MLQFAVSGYPWNTSKCPLVLYGGDKDLIGTLLRAGLIAEALTKGIMPSRREKEASLELERCFLESKQEVESHSNWTVIF